MGVSHIDLAAEGRIGLRQNQSLAVRVALHARTLPTLATARITPIV
jgi:hypothetical protein